LLQGPDLGVGFRARPFIFQLSLQGSHILLVISFQGLLIGRAAVFDTIQASLGAACSACLSVTYSGCHDGSHK
jgi:hypothetical protein